MNMNIKVIDTMNMKVIDASDAEFMTKLEIEDRVIFHHFFIDLLPNILQEYNQTNLPYMLAYKSTQTSLIIDTIFSNQSNFRCRILKANSLNN